MTSELSRKAKITALLFLRFIWRRKGLWLRAVLCWLIGMAFILADREHDYDWRLRIRGPQTFAKEIVMINITRDDWLKWLGGKPDTMGVMKEASYISDSIYWEPQAWQNLLSKILSESPQAIGVTLYFGQNIAKPNIDPKIPNVFSNPKIVWATQIDDEGRILPSRFAKTYSHSSGLNEFLADRDGVIRRFGYSSAQIPHLAVQLVRQFPGQKHKDLSQLSESSQVINFRGGSGTFSQLSLTDLIAHHYSPNFFNNKIVLIGSADNEGVELRTPLGEMSRSEILANLIDNIMYDRWIKRLDPLSSAMLLLLFVILVAFLTSNYPQFLTLFILAWVNILFASVSLWIFDSFYFWLPVLAPIVVSIFTYITYLSFQLTLKEYLNVQLEKERQFLIDVEELKNNVLSLVSHDLKTPIAKIQAICDRLMAQFPSHEFTGDLVALREVASELHRYIRTILQIARVESRDFRINKDAADMNEIIDAVVTQLEPLARHKHIKLEMALEPMFLIEIDQVLIHEVILNLIENAIKYTPESGTVKVSSQEVDDRVLIMVEDTGPGIPIEEQARIFEKFFRGELGKSQPKGSGLGLYLVKYFVELHSGKVFLESTPKSGTKVGFSLPVTEIKTDINQVDEEIISSGEINEART